MDINTRLEKLERENRRMQKIGIVAAVVVSVVIIGGQAKTTIAHGVSLNARIAEAEAEVANRLPLKCIL